MPNLNLLIVNQLLKALKFVLGWREGQNLEFIEDIAK